MNILILAAHPDDEVLGCGGTMARLAKEGHQVYIGIFGEGITSRYENRGDANMTLIKELQACSKQAAELLGIQELLTHRLPDNRFDTVPLLDIVKLVEELTNEVQPEVVFTHHPSDLNLDHALLGRATITATRPVPGCGVKEVYAFESPSSTEWTFQKTGPVFQPDTFYDISDYFHTKIAALKCYRTEMRPAPHPRSTEVVTAIAHRWGSVIGCDAAEAFELIRSIK